MYTVIEGIHSNPNDLETIDPKTKKVHGPYSHKSQAEAVAHGLIQKNIDDYYHRAWVIKK